MRPLTILILVFFYSLDIFSQTTKCSCTTRHANEEGYSFTCDTTIFKNGAMLYWQWNCDSAWLTFQNKEKVILKSCGDEFECSRIGLNFIKEYPNYLLFIYKWISGCCTPPDILLISKETGIEIRRVSNDRFVWGDADEDYILYFSDTTLTTLVYLNHNTDNQYKLAFKTGKVEDSARKHGIIQLTDIFKNFKKNKDYFEFSFINSDDKVEVLKINIE